ncbi:MAG TPA: alpha-ketoacid dehydrogenase subunit beta, partial [Actinobacteria bacterium]|nr:alpha-ketoacid dehydrogenase subunit beta [Actinomycetota bacterium]
ESKPLYRSLKGPVPRGEHTVPLGVAAVVRQGWDATVISYGAMVHQALTAAETLAADGIDIEVVDLRSLKPLDEETVLGSVTKKGRALVVHAANRLAGIGAEIAAAIAEDAFESLDAPVMRIGGLDTPVPFSPPLEDAYRPDHLKILTALRQLVSY